MILLPTLIGDSGIIGDSPRILANEIMKFSNKTMSVEIKNLRISRKVLSDVAFKFHSSANTLTPNVRANILAIENNAPLIRVAHQPNSFAYLNLMAQFIYLDLTAKELEAGGKASSQIFLIVDYDAADDKWFRTTSFPDPNRKTGVFNLNLLEHKTSKHRIINAISVPSNDDIEHWFLEIEQWIKNFPRISISDEKMITDRFHFFKDLAIDCCQKSHDFSEFNAFFLSEIVNKSWNLPTAFIPLSKLVPFLKESYEYLLHRHFDVLSFKNNKSNNELHEDVFPGWLLCEKCSSRVKMIFGDYEKGSISGRCPICGHILIENVKSGVSFNLEHLIHRFIPRCLYCDLCEYIGIQIEGGVGYIGSVDHTINSSIIAEKLGGSPPPEVFWRSTGYWGGFTERIALDTIKSSQNPLDKQRAMDSLKLTVNGRASIVYMGMTVGLNEIKRSLTNHLTRVENASDPLLIGEGNPKDSNLYELIKILQEAK